MPYAYAEYAVNGASGAAGIIVALRPSGATRYEALIGMPVACGYTTNVPPCTVSGSIRSLKPTWIIAFVGTLLALATGLVTVTTGAMRSTPVAVVKCCTTGVAGTP